MGFKSEKNIKINGVSMDFGASRRGTDMGPSALRIAGLGAAISDMGYTHAIEEDIVAPAPEPWHMVACVIARHIC
jgi:arginase